MVAVLAIAVVAVFTIASIGQLLGGGHQQHTSSVDSSPHPRRSSEPRPRTDETPRAEPPSSRPSPTPSKEESEEPRTEPSKEPSKKPKKKAKPERQYPKGDKAHQRKQQNYEQVALPDTPTNYDAAWKIVQHSKFYKRSAVNFVCSGQPEEADYPFGNTSKKQFKKTMQKMANCLSDAWSVPLAKAGYQATYARVVVYSGSVSSPCATTDAPAYYCSSNQVVYINIDGGGTGSRGNYQWMWYQMTMAHEYGHHIQARTGIMGSSWLLMTNQETEAGYSEMSRRMELQANCLGGMGLRRLQSFDQGTFEAYSANLNGEDVHGSQQNQYIWYMEGWNQSKTGKCNTYVVDDGYVS